MLCMKSPDHDARIENLEEKFGFWRLKNPWKNCNPFEPTLFFNK